MNPSDEPYAAAEASAAVVAERTGHDDHDVAVVLGSGFAPAAEVLAPRGSATEIAFTDLGGFPAPTVAGHAGKLRSVEVGQLRVLVFVGRVHLYEGSSPGTVVHGVRTACATGCRVVVLTNAAGGINPAYRVGQPVLIRDHLNLTGQSPMSGPPPPPGCPARFVDLSHLYSARLRSLAREKDPSLSEGIYASLPGPHYETPAEVALLQRLGADLVGMSTALEAIAAHHLGAEVLGISLVTNVAARVGEGGVGAGRVGAGGVGAGGVSHQEVIATGTAAAASVGSLVAGVLERLA
jgi:purine-nucleoside phosphorylase